MKIATVLMVMALLVAACGNPKRAEGFTATIPTNTEVAQSSTPTEVPTTVPTPTASPTPTPLPDIGKSYTGYWLKMSKEIGPSGSQTMYLYYQDGFRLDLIATFCVRAGDNNTPDGFYFIAIDRPTTFPHAPEGYKTIFYSHNFGWKIGFRNGKSANWYLHSADWNTSGINGCPTRGSGGCVNMRNADFNILLNGGDYVNPITGDKVTVPDLSVGTPFVIVDTESACTYLGQCLKLEECASGRECFHKYTCEYCLDWGTLWDQLRGNYPALVALDK